MHLSLTETINTWQLSTGLSGFLDTPIEIINSPRIGLYQAGTAQTPPRVSDNDVVSIPQHQTEPVP
jgi:hypothetical protein